METKNTNGGISVFTILLVIFVVLKLVHVIEWSWLWVLAPLWIPAALAGISIILYLLVMIINNW